MSIFAKLSLLWSICFAAYLFAAAYDGGSLNTATLLLLVLVGIAIMTATIIGVILEDRELARQAQHHIPAPADPEHECEVCNGYGSVGLAPDDYWECPACTPQQITKKDGNESEK